MKSKSRSKKRKRSNHENREIAQKSDGLRQAVLEVLQGYVPRSSEKLPFYCRVCSHQSTSEEEFLEHKQTAFHKTAVQVERKNTYCKLCRKQLTSIVQMQEHLKSGPHRERLDFVQARQRGGTGDMRGRRYNNGNSSRGRGYSHNNSSRGRGYNGRGSGAQRQHPRHNDEKRQWC